MKTAPKFKETRQATFRRLYRVLYADICNKIRPNGVWTSGNRQRARKLARAQARLQMARDVRI